MSDISEHLAFGHPAPEGLKMRPGENPALAVAVYQSAQHILRSSYSGAQWCGHCGQVALVVNGASEADWREQRSAHFRAHKGCRVGAWG